MQPVFYGSNLGLVRSLNGCVHAQLDTALLAYELIILAGGTTDGRCIVTCSQISIVLRPPRSMLLSRA